MWGREAGFCCCALPGAVSASLYKPSVWCERGPGQMAGERCLAFLGPSPSSQCLSPSLHRVGTLLTPCKSSRSSARLSKGPAGVRRGAGESAKHVIAHVRMNIQYTQPLGETRSWKDMATSCSLLPEATGHCVAIFKKSQTFEFFSVSQFITTGNGFKILCPV